jgi:hypothetical protein
MTCTHNWQLQRVRTLRPGNAHDTPARYGIYRCALCGWLKTGEAG